MVDKGLFQARLTVNTYIDGSVNSGLLFAWCGKTMDLRPSERP